MVATLPTIVLVPGAWHSPIHYQYLLKELEKAGSPIVSSPLPSLDHPNPDELTVSDDANFI